MRGSFSQQAFPLLRPNRSKRTWMMCELNMRRVLKDWDEREKEYGQFWRGLDQVGSERLMCSAWISLKKLMLPHNFYSYCCWRKGWRLWNRKLWKVWWILQRWRSILGKTTRVWRQLLEFNTRWVKFKNIKILWYIRFNYRGSLIGLLTNVVQFYDKSRCFFTFNPHKNFCIYWSQRFENDTIGLLLTLHASFS